MKLRNFDIDNSKKMTLMGGMNVLESRDLAMEVAEKFKEATSNNNINYIFKGSFDKANRSSINSYRGPGLEEGLKILEEVSNTFDVPVITDIHEPHQAQPVSEICEVMQIPSVKPIPAPFLSDSAFKIYCPKSSVPIKAPIITINNANTIVWFKPSII